MQRIQTVAAMPEVQAAMPSQAEKAIQATPKATASKQLKAAPEEAPQAIVAGTMQAMPIAPSTPPAGGTPAQGSAGDTADGCFVSVTEKSPLSVPARVMTELGLQRVVWFVLRGGTDEQREYLHTLIGRSVICRVPLARARRQMIICRAIDGCSDHEHIRSYRAVLEHVFGEKCRISVRVMLNAAHGAIEQLKIKN